MKKFGFIICFVLLIQSCGEQSPQPEICAPNLLCTEELRFLTFSPQLHDEPLIFDNYYVRNTDNGNIYDENSLDQLLEEGTYVIASDLIKDELKKSGTTLRFVGAKDGQVMLEQDFVVGHDCCHILPLEGPFDE